MSLRIARYALVSTLLAALAACGYKGNLVMPDAQDEKAGQVKPEPVPERADD